MDLPSTLTDEQLHFITDITRVLSDVKVGMFLLRAFGGTGKSYSIKNLILSMKNKFTYKILAPTHKAKEVLVKSGMKCDTIHKFFNSQMEISDDGEIQFIFAQNIDKYNIIIVDECSMVDDKMYELFTKISDKCIVLFVGDNMQLPPISKDISVCKLSPIFRMIKLENTYKFTKNMRTANEACLKILKSYRNGVKRNIIAPVESFIEEDDVIAAFFDDPDSIVLAYSNQRVNQLNRRIRRRKFLNSITGKLESLYINERVIFTGHRITPVHTYYSSDTIDIKELSIVDMSLHKYLEFYAEEKYLKYYRIIDQYNVTWYKPYDQDAIDHFQKIQQEFLKICKKERSKEVWKMYYTFNERFNPNLAYSYCITVHKSQGSEWNTVFVDRSNILDCCKNTTDLLTRALYTAVSRMRENVFIF